MNPCRVYASYARSMTSLMKEIPLIVSILFIHHKRLMDLEKRTKWWSLEWKSPAETAWISVSVENKRITIIQNASKKARTGTQSISLTIPLVVLPVLGIFLFFVDYTVPFSLKTEGFEVTTKSGALAVIALWIWFAVEVVRHPVQTGKYSSEQAVYDPPRFGESQPSIECPKCGTEIPRFHSVCPKCGYNLACIEQHLLTP